MVLLIFLALASLHEPETLSVHHRRSILHNDDYKFELTSDSSYLDRFDVLLVVERHVVGVQL